MEVHCSRQEQILQAATDFWHMGVQTTPVDDHRHFFKDNGWRKLGQERLPLEEVLAPFKKEWYRPVEGLAAVLGPVNNCLCCLDWDLDELYWRWVESHQGLFRTLPTSMTNRGYQVFFRNKDVWKTVVQRLNDEPIGELRGGAGAVCYMPPSLHPKKRERGCACPYYAWTFKTPRSIDNFPWIEDLREVGATALPTPPDLPVQKDTARISPRMPQDGSKVIQGRCVVRPKRSERAWVNLIAEMVQVTRPTGIGERNNRLRLFVSRLTNYGLPDHLAAYAFGEWWRAAEGVVGTNDVRESSDDFWRAWGLAEVTPLSVVGVGGTDRERTLSICRELSVRGGGTFFLSGEDLARLLGGKSRQHAQKMLRHLVRDGELRLIARGSGVSGKASTYSLTYTS